VKPVVTQFIENIEQDEDSGSQPDGQSCKVDKGIDGIAPEDPERVSKKMDHPWYRSE